MIAQATAYRALGLTLVATIVVAGFWARGTLNDREFGRLLFLGPPLVVVVATGLAARWGTALLAGYGVALIQGVCIAVGTGFQAANSPLCQECGTCCEGAAMVTLLGAPFFAVLALAWLPVGSAAVRGLAMAFRWSRDSLQRLWKKGE